MKIRNTKKIVFSTIVCLFCVSTTAFALSNSLPWKSHPVDEFVEQEIIEKNIRGGKTGETGKKGLEVASGYDYFLEKATNDEQKSKIKDLKDDKSLGLGEWKEKP